MKVRPQKFYVAINKFHAGQYWVRPQKFFSLYLPLYFKDFRLQSGIAGKTLKDLLKKGKNRSERQAAIYLSKVLSGKKNIEVGRYFGIKGSAVSETLKAVEQRMIEDEMFQRDIKKLN